MSLKKAYQVVKKDYHKFEVDPEYQLVYHRKMIRFWLVNFIPMNIVVAVDIAATLDILPAKIALLMTALLLAINTNYSLYANLDTEIGDAHGAYASLKAKQIQENQVTFAPIQANGNTIGVSMSAKETERFKY